MASVLREPARRRPDQIAAVGADGTQERLILRDGYDVYPRQVEEVTARDPAVDHVAVTGPSRTVLKRELRDRFADAAHR